MNLKRITGYDSIKGLAIILVCLGHILQSNFIDYKESRVFLLIYAIQMPLFIIVSGFFSINKEIDDLKVWWNKIIARFIAYMIPFFSRAILFEKIFHTNDISITSRFHKIFFESLDSGLWYLYVAFILYFTLSLTNLIVHRFGFKTKGINFFVEGGVYVGLLIPWCIIAVVYGTGFMGSKFVLYYSVFYFFGYCLKKYIDPVLEGKRVEDYLVALSMLVGVWIACNCNILAVEDTLLSISERMAAGLLLSYSLIKLVLKKDKVFETIKLDRLGKYTLEIYYVHGIAFSLMAKSEIFKLYSVDGLLQFILECLITAVYTTLIVATIKSNKITDFLFFGKRTLERK